MTYQSKIDWLFMVIVVGAMLVSAFALYKLIMQGNLTSTNSLIGLTIITLAGLLLPGSLLLATNYSFSDDKLLVRSGFFSWQVRYDEIKSYHENRSILSAPALSIDRLTIVHKRGEITISPRDKKDFIAELQQRLPSTNGA